MNSIMHDIVLRANAYLKTFNFQTNSSSPPHPNVKPECLYLSYKEYNIYAINNNDNKYK